MNPPQPLDVTHLRRLATRLFTDGQFFDADQVLAALAESTDGDGAQIALRRAQIGMLSDNMAHVREHVLERRSHSSGCSCLTPNTSPIGCPSPSLMAPAR